MKSYMRHIPFIIVLAIVSLVMTRGDDGAKRPRAGVWSEVLPVLPAPEAPMRLDDKGGHASLADYKGQVVLLNIWATWCPPCLRELPTLKRLDGRYRDKGLKVVALSIDALPFSEVEGFLRDKVAIELPGLAQDDTGEIYKHLNVQGLPVTYLIDREGMITHRFIGETDWTKESVLVPVEAALKARSAAR